MDNLKNSFISKDFIINSNVVRNISNIDITLDEFLLVLYFINVSCSLDSVDIEKKLGFNEEKIFNVFTSLIEKKYVELDVVSDSKGISEKIKLDPFYDKLIFNQNNNSKDESEIFSLFESELGRTLSSYEFELVNQWISNGISEDTIKNAIKEATKKDIRNFKYISKIIYEWNKKGIENNIKEEDKEEVFDYNWLDDNE